MPEIPTTAIDRIIRYAGANRVSYDAAETLRNITEDFCLKIAKKAVELAMYRAHQTVTDEDIKQAYRIIFQIV
jgi:histone H3/H4